MNSISAESASSTEEVVSTALVNCGWVVCECSQGWMKSFETAVGPKVAYAYLSAGDSYNRSLCGDYQSEGRNILSSCVVLLPVTSDDEEMRSISINFTARVDRAVHQSYAGRLHRLFAH